MMPYLQKAGGIAGVCLSVLFVISFVFILVIWPRAGVTGPAEVADPALILPAVANVPLLSFWLGINVPIAAALLFVLLALDEQLHSVSPGLVRVATCVGLAAALLFFTVGALRFTSYRYFASLYQQNAATVSAAYLSYLVVDMSFDHAAIFASGWWLLLINGVARKAWARQLSYFGLLAGVSGVLGAGVPSIAPLALSLYILWFLWAGMLLLSKPFRA
jgi:hypothetical protein